MKLEPTSCVWPWLIEHAAYTLRTGVVGHDGLTAHERYKGRSAQTNIVAFAEKVLYKPSKTIRLAANEARWEDGIWMGIITESNEHIIGTDKGVVKCRAIMALEESKKFNKENLESVRGVPWQPNPNINSNRITTKIAERGEGNEDETAEESEAFKMQVQDEEDVDAREIPKKPDFGNLEKRHRGLYIRKEDVHQYGRTKGCAGCTAVIEK
eukprot:12422783-Karenia_brevis.AAC.1